MSELISLSRAQANATLALLNTAAVLTLIRVASARIEKYCRRAFTRTQRIEIQDGDGTQNMYLRAFPVISVSSVVVRWCDDSTTTYVDTEIRFNALTGELQFVAPGLVFPGGFQNITITYVAGFELIPEDVQEACVHMMLWVQQQTKTNPLLSSIKIGDYEERYRDQSRSIDSEMTVPPIVRQFLSAYRLVGI